MIEEIMLQDVEKYSTIPVYTETPKDAPAEYYKIEKTADTITDHLGHATFAVQSYGKTMYGAAEKNEYLKRIIRSLPWLDERIGCAKVISDYNYTDTTSKHYRYQAVVQVIYYEDNEYIKEIQ